MRHRFGSLAAATAIVLNSVEPPKAAAAAADQGDGYGPEAASRHTQKSATLLLLCRTVSFPPRRPFLSNPGLTCIDEQAIALAAAFATGASFAQARAVTRLARCGQSLIHTVYFSFQPLLMGMRALSHAVMALRAAGYSDAQIVEIISLSAQFLVTNFVNNAVDTTIDFPVIGQPAELT
jgi:hypothetical protein